MTTSKSGNYKTIFKCIHNILRFVLIHNNNASIYFDVFIRVSLNLINPLFAESSLCANINCSTLELLSKVNFMTVLIYALLHLNVLHGIYFFGYHTIMPTIFLASLNVFLCLFKPTFDINFKDWDNATCRDWLEEPDIVKDRNVGYLLLNMVISNQQFNHLYALLMLCCPNYSYKPDLLPLFIHFQYSAKNT